ncbi:hypothetical protein F4782DRAFT_486428 [Xylaria castorea]|nr:hypothetical protein F4782DRAFT_486428 [Xylaria castorea]
MKLLLIFSAAALVYAQADSTGYFPGEPSCALPCLSSAITAAGCQLSDIACQCGPTQSVIANKVAGCILSSCTNPTELGEAVNAGEAVCSSFLAGELSFTQPGGPALTPTPVPGSSGSASGTSVILTNPPTPTPTTSSGSSGSDSGSSSSESSGGFSSETGSGTMTTGGTHTDTLIGPSTPIITGSVTSLVPSSPTSSPAGAAANSARLGAGVLAGIVGAVAFL